MKITKESIKGFKEVEVPYTLLTHQEDVEKLAIFLPGAGYTTQSPVFHYAEDIFLNKGYNILKINYQYNVEPYLHFSTEELSEVIKYDVRIVLDKILINSPYKNFYLVGKSIGTIAMSTELNRDIFGEAKAIWLTPLIHRDDVLKAMVSSENRGLCFIGDNDRCYSKERYSELLVNQNIVSKLLPAINHNLDYNNEPVKSVDTLKEILENLEKF